MTPSRFLKVLIFFGRIIISNRDVDPGLVEFSIYYYLYYIYFSLIRGLPYLLLI